MAITMHPGPEAWASPIRPILNRAMRRVAVPFAIAALTCLAACDTQTSTSAPEPTGAADPQVAPAPEAWPHEASDIPVDPAVTWGRLDTGLRYAVMANTTPRNTVSMRLYVGAGSLNERDDQRGVAHFLEHMAFKGSEALPGDELVKFLERLGLAFGPDTNAFTSFDQTVYQLELPEADAILIGEGLKIFREYAGRLTLDGKAIDDERGVILSEMRFRNSPEYQRTKALYGFLLPEHRLSERFPIGTAEVIETAPRDVFVDFYKDFYRPENMILVVVGDIDPAEMETRIRDMFADYTVAGPGGTDPVLSKVVHDAPRADSFSDPDVATQVQLFGVGPVPDKTDTKANRRRDLVLALGNRILSRRIAALSRREDAVFLSGGAAAFDLLDVAHLSLVTLTTTPENWEASLAVAEQELRRALEYGFNEAELAEQVANFENALVDAVNGAGTRESSGLAGAIVNVLHDDRVFSTPETELALFREATETLTADEVSDVMRALWAGRPVQVFVSGDLDIEDPSATVIAALEESRTVAVEAPAEAGAQTFAYTDFGTPGTVASRDRVEDLGIDQVRFANNVQLNIKQTDFEDDTIRISVRIDGGKIAQPMDKPGLDLLAEQVVVSGGLEAHSLDDIVRLYAGVSAEIQFAVDSDAFAFGGTTDPDDLDRQLDLLAAFVTAPGFRPEALSRFAKSVDVLYETIDATPAGIVRRDVSRLIRDGDPRFGLPERASLEALTIEDVRAWITPALRNGYLEIGLVGDVDPEAAIAAVARTFGALDPRADAPETHEAGRRLSFPDDLSAPVVLRHEGEPDRALSQLYWKATDSRDRTVARRLSMLASVMRLRLTEIARRQDGATYSPGVSSYLDTTYPDYGYLVASLDLKPEDTARYIETLTTVAREIAENGISDDEFLRAQKPIVEAVEERLERNSYWLGSVVSVAQSQPAELEAARAILEDYRTMTKADVEAVARLYLTGLTAPVIILPRAEQEEGAEE